MSHIIDLEEAEETIDSLREHLDADAEVMAQQAAEITELRAQLERKCETQKETVASMRAVSEAFSGAVKSQAAEIAKLREAAKDAMRTLGVVEEWGKEIGDNLLEDVEMSLTLLRNALNEKEGGAQ
jgi:hypothetical protein